MTKFLILVFVFQQITCAGKCSVRQGVQSVALELHICEFRLRMSDTLAVVSPAAEISLLDGDTVLLEDATRVRDERGGTCTFGSRSTAQLLQRISSQSTHFSPQCERDYVSRRVRKKTKQKKKKGALSFFNCVGVAAVAQPETYSHSISTVRSIWDWTIAI